MFCLDTNVIIDATSRKTASKICPHFENLNRMKL